MISDKAALKDIFKSICDKYSLHIEDDRENGFKIFTDHSTGLTLFLNFEEQTNFSFYFLLRTYDVVYDGDRTDVHVVMSLMFASFIRLFDQGISCSLLDIPHPVIEDEIWGRYIMPGQTPSLLGISSVEQEVKKASEIIELIAFWRDFFWGFASCPCKECFKAENSDNLREYGLSEEISKMISKLSMSSSHINYGNRIRPNWDFYYDMDDKVTIIKSRELSLYLTSVIEFNKRNPHTIDGINGKLIIDKEIRNFFHKKSRREFTKITKALLDNKKQIDYEVILLENMIISVVDQYIIALGRLAGINEFKIERELIRKRHNKESEILFPIPLFEWQENPCPEQFERLIKSLLEREPNVKIVRIPAPINQGDKGRDLLIDWNIPNQNIITEFQPPTSLIKVVGQCKVSNGTIGKSKVLDIRDTIETHNSNGYFLAVSTQISAPLTEKLEELQTKGIWTTWWNREDIEIRLSKNQDLLPQFPKVLSAKQKIKFVDNKE